MDPDANIAEQLRLITKLFKQEEDNDDFHTSKLNPNDVMRLCNLVEALDAWLKQGNFLPKRWERK